MTINYNNNNGELYVNIEGRLDTTTAPELETFMNDNLDGATSLVLDCEKLEYISSAGLRVILAVHKRTKGAMKLKNVCEIVMEVFEITGFADILEIE